MSFPLLLVYTMWVLLLLEPEWWLASFGAEPLKRIPSLLFLIAVGVVLAKADRRCLYWPMALFLVSHMITLPFVTNRGYALGALKFVLMFYVLLVASAATIDTARKALPLLAIYLVQFAWWSIHGLPDGRVGWHSTLSNEDGFGPVMVVGMAFAGVFALGARSKGARIGAILVATLSTIGLVASFARGAVLSAALVLVTVWLRSPRKLAMFVGVLFVVGTIVIASHMLFPDGFFWTEMQSITGGFQDPTGADRGNLWRAGWRVFLQSPLFGVGPANFGAYAAEHFGFGDAPGFYEDPAHLYGRNLHNIYVQVLSEQGLIGVAVFLFILVDFVRRNRSLRTKSALERWDKATNGRLDLRWISLGLEGAMVGYLATGVFYDQLYTSSLYSLVALNFILYSVTTPRVSPPKRAPAARHASGSAERRTDLVDTPGHEQGHRPKWAPKVY
jgi:O-antigen ligase